MELQSHFGRKSPAMAMEYVTKSKVALKDVAEMLSRGDTVTVSQVCVIVSLISLLTT